MFPESNVDKMLAEVTKSLGIPPRVFHGSPSSVSMAGQLWLERERVRLETLRQCWGDQFIRPIMLKLFEEHLPEMFWEPIFLLSPRGRMLRRRDNPVEITFT